MDLARDINKALDMAMGRVYDTSIKMDYWQPPLQKGDRVRIREGYDGAGTALIYEAKMNDEAGKVIASPVGSDVDNFLLAEAIEAYPYTREERIGRAIEDLEALASVALCDKCHAVLFAILDAGV